MKLIVLDWETFYDIDYSLSKLTTEEYVRDPRFESILVAIKVGSAKPYYVPGPDIKKELLRVDIEHNAMLAHHMHFDGLIANHHYGIRPKLLLCTLGMGRALHGANGRLSLDKLAERYGLPQKGKEVHNVKGMRLQDFDAAGLRRYGEYSCLDADLCYMLAERMLPHFSRQELEIHDRIIRMFTEPCMRLDVETLERYAEDLAVNKAKLLEEAGIDKDSVMSNEKFAKILLDLGVEPPLKQSPSWLKKPPELRDPAKEWVYAFAKTDKAMQELQEHEDEQVQAVVEARLENKTTIAEKGARRLIGMAGRGLATVYLKYSGASGTHRLSGGDKFNWQSMKRGSPLRDAVMAEEGEVCIAGDSSNIEARVVDWLAGQDDMVYVYRKADRKEGPDVYCVLASRIYKRPVIKEQHPMERQMGKVAKLGLGFGMGDEKFVSAVRSQAKDERKKPLVISREFSKEVVGIYRAAHPQVKKLWARGGDALRAIAEGRCGVPVDYRGIVKTCKDGLQMPDGLKILFPDLQFKKAAQGWGGEWTFWNGKEREKIYGAKLIENIVQCLARIIVFEQCRKTAKECEGIAKWAHSVHDEGIFVAKLFYAPYVLDKLLSNMRIPPAWAPDLPLNSEGGFHERYGRAKS
jgi:DNA polymerase